jgi:hypothetical protein
MATFLLFILAVVVLFSPFLAFAAWQIFLVLRYGDTLGAGLKARVRGEAGVIAAVPGPSGGDTTIRVLWLDADVPSLGLVCAWQGNFKRRRVVIKLTLDQARGAAQALRLAAQGAPSQPLAGLEQLMSAGFRDRIFGHHGFAEQAGSSRITGTRLYVVTTDYAPAPISLALAAYVVPVGGSMVAARLRGYEAMHCAGLIDHVVATTPA